MITPTRGRSILFNFGITTEGQTRENGVGQICKVNEDGTINVGGFNAYGTTFGQNGVQLLQDGETPPALAAYAEWMPYQNTNAVKTEPATPAPLPAESTAEHVEAIKANITEHVEAAKVEITDHAATLRTDVVAWFDKIRAEAEGFFAALKAKL